MSRILLLLVLAAGASLSAVFAQDTGSRQGISKEVMAVFENACAVSASWILTGVVVGNPQDNIALCNKHPDRESCLMTKTFIAQRNHGDTRGLTCDGR